MEEMLAEYNTRHDVSIATQVDRHVKHSLHVSEKRQQALEKRLEARLGSVLDMTKLASNARADRDAAQQLDLETQIQKAVPSVDSKMQAIVDASVGESSAASHAAIEQHVNTAVAKAEKNTEKSFEKRYYSALRALESSNQCSIKEHGDVEDAF